MTTVTKKTIKKETKGGIKSSVNKDKRTDTKDNADVIPYLNCLYAKLSSEIEYTRNYIEDELYNLKEKHDESYKNVNDFITTRTRWTREDIKFWAKVNGIIYAICLGFIGFGLCKIYGIF